MKGSFKIRFGSLGGKKPQIPPLPPPPPPHTLSLFPSLSLSHFKSGG